MKPGIVQRIFLDHYAALQRTRRLDARSRWAAWNILTCRTPEQGFHIDECPKDGYRVVLNNSCKHRGCPLCGATETELWLERQRAKELACPHHHIVFTSPDSLRPLWRTNRRLFTDLYFQAAWHALRELLADPRWLGALPGVVAVFQSWGDELQEHLHLHFIVTCGGLTADGRWQAGNPRFLLPVPVLAAKFRGKFLAYLRQALDGATAGGQRERTGVELMPPPDMSVERCRTLLNKLGRVPWHVQIEAAYEQARGALKYAGRYVCRGPLSERRIESYDGEGVTIAYAHGEKHAERTFMLTAERFMLRLLNHVPAKGTHVARTYGLYHSRCRERLNAARALFAQAAYRPAGQVPDTHELLHRMFADFTGDLCPLCGSRLVTVYVQRPGGALPRRRAA